MHGWAYAMGWCCGGCDAVAVVYHDQLSSLFHRHGTSVPTSTGLWIETPYLLIIGSSVAPALCRTSALREEAVVYRNSGCTLSTERARCEIVILNVRMLKQMSAARVRENVNITIIEERDGTISHRFGKKKEVRKHERRRTAYRSKKARCTRTEKS
jgi:hypothetical protein